MNLYFRLLYTLVVSFWQGRASVHSEHRLRLRTYINDLDMNMHMNNGRFLTLMDLGRVQLMIRLGLFFPILKNRWMPVVAAIHMQYKKSLAPLQAFELVTTIHSWDEKWIYIEQKFLAHGQLLAIGMVKGVIKSSKGTVPIAELMALIGHETPSHQPIPEVFKAKEKV